jgi:hypothetical protein
VAGIKTNILSVSQRRLMGASPAAPSVRAGGSFRYLTQRNALARDAPFESTARRVHWNALVGGVLPNGAWGRV